MDQEHSAAICIFVVALMAICLGYMKHLASTLSMNGQNYTLAGVMKYEDKGNTIYVPVYKRN